MSADRRSRTVKESSVQMTEIVLPEDTNPKGTIFGGRVLALIDKCAAIAAIRHARCLTVTAALDSVVFVNRVYLGDVLVLCGRLNAAFESSMEIEVEVHSEQPSTGERRLTTKAFVTMVAVDPDGRPRAVPALEATGDGERKRAAAAAARRRNRLIARGQSPA